MTRSRSVTLLQGSFCTMILLGISGCVSILQEERVGPPVRSVEASESRATGVPRLALRPHDDQQGWTVKLDRHTEHASIYKDVQQWRGRRYVFSPLSIVPGLFQCPVGLLHLFDQNPSTNILRFGCARLLMFEPLDGVAPLPPETSVGEESTVEWEPVGHGLLQLMWAARPQYTISYAVPTDGRIDVRLSDLLSRSVSAGPLSQIEQLQAVTFRLRYDDGSHVEETHRLDARQVQHMLSSIRKPLPLEAWPSPLIIQVRVHSANRGSGEDAFLVEHIQRHMLAQTFCVVMDELQSHVRDELKVQFSGVVDDSKQVRVGLLAPSITLVASTDKQAEASGETRRMVIEFRDMREGKIFATASASSSAGDLRHVLERTLTELDLLMANAPRTGCPRSRE